MNQKKSEVVNLHAQSRNPEPAAVSTKSGQRTGWSAGLAASEIQLRGSTLLAWLIETANERGLQLKQLASEIGVTYGYIHQLRSGLKPIPGISEKVINRCARFLGVPRLAILIAADVIRVDDFYSEPDSVCAYLEPALHLMQRDPEVGCFVHPAVFNADDHVKHLVVLLYELATKRKVIPTKVNLQALLDAFVSPDSESGADAEYSRNGGKYNPMLV